MNSLVYLVFTGAKNGLKELLHKPRKLVLYLLVVLAIGAGLVATLFANARGEASLPQYWLRGIYFAFLVLFYAIAVYKGLTSGDAIFEMSDVNLLFVSPVNPRSILLYGLVRLAKASFWAGFFILFQGANLANFGVGFGGLWVLFLLFILLMMVLSLLSLVVYSASNGHPRRKMAVRVLAVLPFLPLAVYFVVQLLASGDALAALAAAVQSPFLSFIPFIGWTAAAAGTLLAGNLLAGLGWVALLLLGGGGLLAYTMLSKADYYEDVLVATETAFERKRAAEEGDLNAAAASPAKVRVTRTGIRGHGATAIFYKHLRETFRQSRLGFFSVYTLILFASALALSIFLRGVLDVVILLQILMWMQIFMVGNGRGLRELCTHYIYLIPEPPFKKVVWSNMELVFKTLLESVLLLGIPGLIMGGSPLVILASMLAYTLFTLLLLGINYLSMRWTGASLSQGLLLTIYFFAVVLILLPGLVPALIVGFLLGGVWGTALGLGILCAWELLAALGCFALSKNVLHNCDMPSAKPQGK